MIDQGNQNNKLLKILLGVVGIFVLLCGAGVLVFLYPLGRAYFEPKAKVILEPDYSRVTAVNPSELEAAARILTERCHIVGCGASFAVAENNQIIVQVRNSAKLERLVGTTAAIGLLELVDFDESPVSPGVTIATDFDYAYFLAVEGTKWHTLITNPDFESANVTRDQVGQYQISFTLTSNGARKLSDYTTSNIGHYLGIVLDKVVLSAPKILSPITDGRAVISGNFTQEQAASLASYLNVPGPLPIPLVVKDILQSGQ